MSNRRDTFEAVVISRLITAVTITASAVVAVNSGLEPTGRPVLDFVWLSLFGAATGTLALRSPRSLLILFGLVALIAESRLGVVMAASIAAIGLFGADTRGFTSRVCADTEPLRLAIGALAGPLMVGALFDIADLAGSGSSAVLAGLVWLAFAASAMPRSFPRGAAVPLVAVTLVVGVVAALAVHGLLRFQENADLARTHGDNVASAVRSGDFELAAIELDALESSTARAVHTLNSVSLTPARALPIVSQNLQTAERVASSAQDVAGAARVVVTIARSGEELFSNGSVTVEQVRAIADSGDALRIDAEVLGEVLVAERSPWVLPPIDDALDAAREQLVPLIDQSEGAAALASLSDALLGAGEPRQYLVLFANPAEARELGGHTGSTAVLRVVDGEFSLVETRRNGILNQTPTSLAVVEAPLPIRYLEHRPWQFAQNYTGTSDLPTVAAALDDIFPAVASHEIDGVLYVDPIALEALIGLSGPVSLNSVERTFERGDLANFLLRGQYAEFNPTGEREVVFAELGAAAFDALTGGEIDASGEDLERIARVIRQGRLAFAPIDPDERAAMDALGVSGAITELRDDADYLAVSHVNAGPNKLDAYLHRDIRYDVETTGESLSATATISLDNRAPAGLPEFVDGNGNGLPPGTNRMTLVVHTPHELVSWGGADDEPELTRSFREYGRWRHERIVVVPRGENRTITIELMGTAHTGDYQLDLDAQPLIHADDVDVSVETGESTSTATLRLHHDTTVRPS